MSIASNNMSMEIQGSSKALRGMSSSSDQNSGLLVLMDYGSDNDILPVRNIKYYLVDENLIECPIDNSV